MEVIDLGALNEINDLPVESSRPSSNLGTGIELLMNENKISSKVDLNLGELDNLEDELNELSGHKTQSQSEHLHPIHAACQGVAPNVDAYQ